MEPRHRAATGFDAVADRYDRSRPDYPLAALELLSTELGLATGPRVLELGAGTGKLTAALLERGAHVVAVEPLDNMRHVLERRLGAAGSCLEILTGSAEELPLPDAAVAGRAAPAAAVAAQAFHWFDAPRALAELRRVLAPTAAFAVLLNRRDLDDPAQVVIDELLAPHRGDTPTWGSEDWRDHLHGAHGFGAPTSVSFPHAQRLDRRGFRDRVASVSFVAQLDATTRRQLDRDADARFTALAGGDTIELRYVTELHVLRREA